MGRVGSGKKFVCWLGWCKNFGLGWVSKRDMSCVCGAVAVILLFRLHIYLSLATSFYGCPTKYHGNVGSPNFLGPCLIEQSELS